MHENALRRFYIALHFNPNHSNANPNKNHPMRTQNYPMSPPKFSKAFLEVSWVFKNSETLRVNIRRYVLPYTGGWTKY